MASTELYSSIAKPKKKYTFGQKLGDLGRLYADTQLSMLGASDVISDDAYKGEWAEKASGILSPIAGVAGQVALAAATGGTGNAALSAAKAVGPEIFAKGGLRTFEGNTHEQGGIKLGADEVENNESMFPIDNQTDFIFSDRITVPGSKQSFAAKSKRISKKYSLRPNDPYGKKSEELELKNLAELQEAVKTIDTPDEMFADGGIHIKKSNRGKFTKSAKAAGMGVQEFARHVLANKEDYSPTQVKRANFARNAAGWQHAMGGMRYDGGGGRFGIYPDYLTLTPKNNRLGINDLYGGSIPGRNISSFLPQLPALSEEGYIDDIPSFDTVPSFNYDKIIQDYNNAPITVPEATFGMYNDNFKMSPLGAQVNPTEGKFKSKSLAPVTKSSAATPYQSNFTLPALGYAAQALTNIPALFTKPETINSSRVKFDRINLAEQRNEARRSRNLGLATARGIGATDAGQMMNYLSGTTAGLNSLYGNQFNQSLLQEQQANAEMNMREQLANSEIERYDEQINAQERDAARALRMNALQNLGTIAAGAGRDYMAMQENDAMMNVLMGSNPDYTYDVNAPTGRMKWLKSKTLTPKRRKK